MLQIIKYDAVVADRVRDNRGDNGNSREIRV